MTQLASDNFTRANGALGANWGSLTGVGAPDIESNQARMPASTGFGGALTEVGTWTSITGQYSEITVGSVVCSVTDEGVGAIIRAPFSGNLNGYISQSNAVETRLYKVVNGTFTQLGSNGPAVTTGDVIRITGSGTTISVAKNGTTIISVTDSSVASGTPGIWTTDAGGRGSISLWAAGDLTAGTPIAVLASSYNQQYG